MMHRREDPPSTQELQVLNKKQLILKQKVRELEEEDHKLRFTPTFPFPSLISSNSYPFFLTKGYRRN